MIKLFLNARYNVVLMIQFVPIHAMTSWSDSCRCPIFPEKDQKKRLKWGICQEQLSKMAFFKVYLKSFSLEKFLSWMNSRFSWAIQICCRKPHFEILKTLGFTRLWNMPKSLRKWYLLLLLKTFSSPDFNTF